MSMNSGSGNTDMNSSIDSSKNLGTMSSKDLFMITTFERLTLDCACLLRSLSSSIPIYNELLLCLARVSSNLPSPVPSSTTSLGKEDEKILPSCIRPLADWLQATAVPAELFPARSAALAYQACLQNDQ